MARWGTGAGPGKPGVQEKSWPIESFFNKVVMLRNRLRTLEQQVNASDLPDDQKLKIQGTSPGVTGRSRASTCCLRTTTIDLWVRQESEAPLKGVPGDDCASCT